MKSKNAALASLMLALISWIPLFNFVLAPLSVYFGVKALIKIKKYSEEYNGKIYAVLGIFIGGLITIFNYSKLILDLIK